MLTIGRALMTNPRPADPRRGDRGPRAADRAGDLAHHRARSATHGIATVIVDKNYARRDGDRRSHRDPGQGRGGVRGAERAGALAAGTAAAVPRRLGRARVSPVAFDQRRRAAHRAGTDSRRGVPGRPALVFLHEGLGSVAMWRDFPARVAARDRLRRRSSTRATATASPTPLDGTARRPLHARRGAGRASRRCCDAARGRPPDPRRAQRRRLDRADSRRRRPPGRRPGAAGAARVRRGRVDREHRGRRSRLRGQPTCAPGSPATTTTSTRHSAAGTTSGCTRTSAAGTSRTYLPRIACPVLAIQGEDDEYGTMEQVRRIGAAGARRRRAGARRLPPLPPPRPARRRRSTRSCASSIA